MPRRDCVLLCFLFLLPLKGYDNLHDPQRVRIREEVMSVYQAEGLETGKKALEAFFDKEVRPEERGHEYRAHELYHNLWKQAQLHTENTAWAESLYALILEKSTKGDSSGRTFCFSGMGLITSLVNTALNQGKVEQAREYAEFGKRMSRFHGMNMNLESYESEGPLFSDIPGLTTRDYVISRQYWDPVKRTYGHEPLYYGHFYLHSNVMQLSYDRGDWESAAEYADWMSQYAAQHWEEEKPPIDHQALIHGEWMMSPALATFADIFSLHGFENRAHQVIRQLAVVYPVTAYRSWYGHQVRDIQMMRKKERLHPGSVRWLTASELHLRANVFGGSPYESIRENIMIHFQQGRTEEALALSKKAELYEEIAIDAFREGFHTHPDLEAILIKKLKSIREKGLKIREPELYGVYAAWLKEQGRWEEALAAQWECIRLYEAIRIPNRALEARAIYIDYLHAAGLNDLLQRQQKQLALSLGTHSGKLPESIRKKIEASLRHQGKEAAKTMEVVPSDLQPRSMKTVTLPGYIARTRFSLTNPSQQRLTGTLKISPPGHVVQEGQDVLRISWLAEEEKEGAVELELEAFSEKRIYLMSLLPDEGKERQIDLTWSETGKDYEQLSEWRFSQGAAEKRISLTNASRIRKNPFYLVPIYQSIVRAETGVVESMPFRIRSSVAARVEVYREVDQRLMYVDANGDGDLSGQGDVMFEDDNQNFMPDVRFEEKEDLSEIVIYIHPPEGNEEVIELEVSLLKEGKWVPETVHVLEP